MTVTQLEYIVAVGTCKSFAKAAAQCHITQPTLSMQIKKLEEELNILLFDRSTKPVRPTEIGLQIIEQAKVSLSEIKRINYIVETQEEEHQAELKVGIIPTLSPYLLPLFGMDFSGKIPKTLVTIKEMTSNEIAFELFNSNLDLGILVTPFDSADLKTIPLFYEPFVAYLADTHPLAAENKININDLNLNDMWQLKEGHCFRNQAINICSESTLNPNTNNLKFESGSLETLKRLVEKQSGYTFLPELATLDINENRKHLIKEFKAPKPSREVSLIMPRRFMKRKLVNILKETILENIPERFKTNEKKKVIGWQ